MTFELLALNAMIGGNIEESLDRHCALGLQYLDLKTDFSGSLIEHSSLEIVNKIAAAAEQRDLKVWCLSSCLGNCQIDDSDEQLHTQSAGVEQLILFIPILRPRCVRLIMPRGDAAVVHDKRILNAYRTWCLQLHAAGVQVVMENEIGASIGRDPQLIITFLSNLNLGNTVTYIWDIANQWQEGRFPSREDYLLLKSVIGMLHVKGGQWDNSSQKTYAWKSMLDSSDWPVSELCSLAIQDGVPAICINPPHGKAPEHWSYDIESDVNFLRALHCPSYAHS